MFECLQNAFSVMSALRDFEFHFVRKYLMSRAVVFRVVFDVNNVWLKLLGFWVLWIRAF